MGLFSRTQMFESFKTRALLKYVMNLVEGERMSEINLDGLSFGQREINEMINLLQRYDAADKVFVVSLVDNGLDDESVNLLLQLVFTLPYLRRLDLRRNCISNVGIKRIQDQLKTMEGVTSVIPSATQVLAVHSGNQLRITIDTSEQIPKAHAAPEVDFAVQQELSHVDADPFLATNSGTSNHPWTKTAAAAAQRSQNHAVPDASSIELEKPSVAPQAETFGGPPVGLGGPGNVAALNKKAQAAKGKNRLPDPKKRQAQRAKAAPPPSLDGLPQQRMIDKSQSVESIWGAPSSSRRGYPNEQPRRSASLDRSSSMPSINRSRAPRSFANARV